MLARPMMLEMLPQGILTASLNQPGHEYMHRPTRRDVSRLVDAKNFDEYLTLCVRIVKLQHL